MKSNLILFLLIFSSIFLSSCVTNISDLTKDDYELPTLEEGLGYEIQTSIPKEVFPGNKYPFIVKISNLGINDLEELSYSIQASNDVLLLTDTLGNPFKSEPKTLVKRTYESPQPKFINYNMFMNVTNQGFSSDLSYEEVTLTSQLRFKSEVYSEIEICLKTLKFDISDTSNVICNQNEFNFKSQASPVQLTKVDIQETSLIEEDKTKYIVRIWIDNFDDGNIFNYSVNEPRLKYEDYGIILLDEAFISNDSLNCHKNVLNLNKNENYFECTYERKIDSNIKTQFFAKIKYGYLIKKEDKVKIIYNLNDD